MFSITNATSCVPVQFIANFFLAVGGPENYEEMAWHSSASALDDEDIRQVVSVHEGYVYLIAAHAKDFLRLMDDPLSTPVCPLSAALPGDPNHHGDGIYTFMSAEGMSVIICQNKGVESFRGSVKDMEEFVRAEKGLRGLPVFVADGHGVWKGYRLAQANQARKVSGKMIHLGGIGCAIGVILLATVKIGGAWLSSMANTQMQEAEVKLQAQATNWIQQQSKPSTVVQDLQRLAELSNIALRGQGRIVLFKKEVGKESFELYLPTFASDDTYKSLLGVTARIELTGAGKPTLVVSKEGK